jgi:hypothetical protein
MADWTSDLVISDVGIAFNWPSLPWTCEGCGKKSDPVIARDWKQVSGGPFPAGYRGHFCPKCKVPVCDG